ncbi:ABC transporter substrate-binding protein [Candidatus Pacearchaeota archaeon]|nr:ABC transporter substrate-binding protein [Candidatus Pacearchaeota archaeon]
MCFGGAAPVADENNVVMITPSASITAVKSAKNYTYVFSTWYRTNKEAQELIRHLSASGRKKIILFFGNDPFWQDFSNDLKQSSKNTDIEILQELRFNSVETDFRTHLIKIKSLNPDAIIFGLNDEKALLSFLQQRAILYPDSNLYTTEYIEEFASKDDYNGLLNNVTFISPKSVENEFSEKYRKRFGSNPVFSASNSYDATRMAIQAMENGNFNSADIREYLVRNVFETATFGKISFDEIGGITSGEFVIKTI